MIIRNETPADVDAITDVTTRAFDSVALLIDCSRSTQRERRTELDAVRTFARSDTSPFLLFRFPMGRQAGSASVRFRSRQTCSDEGSGRR